uniref:Uncharacterized protein n=1 Tax=Dunaliella tertiolecta TaxID=3047 RepID=A0A6S8KQI3_DUNTE|mmetsp:Transcript_27216/g.73552  ORF Transcript_27216/g.73552 Transcript_27216/m.73552 type:complete len:137 (+) Transcript_27216:68-478(+)
MSKEDVPAASRAQPWRTSMWDCCNSDSCVHCLLWCCLGSFGGGVSYALLLNKQGKSNADAAVGFVLMCCLEPCACFFASPNRKDIRNKYGLENQPCDDFAVHFLGCCTPCAICQEAREIDYQSSDFSSMPPPPPEK